MWRDKAIGLVALLLALAFSPAPFDPPEPEPLSIRKPLNQHTVTATGYCACVICCGKTNGITSSGTKAKSKHTVAASRGLPFGTRFTSQQIPNTTFVVEDRGGDIKGDRIDIYFDTHQEALNFGRKVITITIKKKP